MWCDPLMYKFFQRGQQQWGWSLVILSYIALIWLFQRVSRARSGWSPPSFPSLSSPRPPSSSPASVASSSRLSLSTTESEHVAKVFLKLKYIWKDSVRGELRLSKTNICMWLIISSFHLQINLPRKWICILHHEIILAFYISQCFPKDLLGGSSFQKINYHLISLIIWELEISQCSLTNMIYDILYIIYDISYIIYAHWQITISDIFLHPMKRRCMWITIVQSQMSFGQMPYPGRILSWPSTIQMAVVLCMLNILKEILQLYNQQAEQIYS